MYTIHVSVLCRMTWPHLFTSKDSSSNKEGKSRVGREGSLCLVLKVLLTSKLNKCVFLSVINRILEPLYNFGTSNHTLYREVSLSGFNCINTMGYRCVEECPLVRL